MVFKGVAIYVGVNCTEDQAMFITEKCSFTDLVNGQALFSMPVLPG